MFKLELNLESDDIRMGLKLDKMSSPFNWLGKYVNLLTEIWGLTFSNSTECFYNQCVQYLRHWDTEILFPTVQCWESSYRADTSPRTLREYSPFLSNQSTNKYNPAWWLQKGKVKLQMKYHKYLFCSLAWSGKMCLLRVCVPLRQGISFCSPLKIP